MPGFHSLASPALAASGGLSSPSFGVSATVGLLALIVAALLWFVGNHLHRAVPLLIITASAGLSATGVGRDIHNAVNSLVADANSESASLLGATIGGVIGIVLAYVVVIHWQRRDITHLTLACAALLPMVAAATPGDAGRFLMWALGLVVSLVNGIFHMAGVG